jgi:ferredoxin
MKFEVSAAACQGHGQCYVFAPNVYEPDDDGYNKAKGRVVDVAPGAEDEAREGALRCPERAITLLEA